VLCCVRRDVSLTRPIIGGFVIFIVCCICGFFGGRVSDTSVHREFLKGTHFLMCMHADE